MAGLLPQKQLHRLIFACLVIGFGTLYGLTVCRIVYWYDSAEYVTAATTLGIPHPPGYPLYTLLGHVFTWLPLEPALAINAMSATFGALSVGMLFLVASASGASLRAATIAASILGTSQVFWSQAVIAEVYCPAQFFLLTTLYLLIRARTAKRLATMVAAGFLAGLGLGVHLSIATVGMGFAVFCWGLRHGESIHALIARKNVAANLRAALAGGGAALAGTLIFLYVPLRASMKPALNFGDPSTAERFWWHITGGNYKHWFLEDFDVIERTGLVARVFYDQLLLAGLALAVIGLASLWRSRRVTALAFSASIAGNLFFFFDYRVHDIEVFFLPTTTFLCLLIAFGIDSAIAVISPHVTPPRRARVIGTLIFCFALIPTGLLAAGYRSIDMSDFDDTTEFIEAAVATLPENAMIVNFTTPPEWKMDAVFGMYLQKVHGVRTDVTVVEVPTPRDVLAALREGRAVYSYVPIAALARFFEIAPDGPFFRILGPRRPPGATSLPVPSAN